MTDRPILMSAPMIRALLEGRKSQTRRLAWRQNWAPGIECEHGYDACPECDKPKPTIWQKVRPGDRLWVRETWCTERVYDKLPPRDLPSGASINWRAGSGNLWPLTSNLWGRTRQSIHMPRWASRITLEVTATKLGRFHEISESDAEASGFEPGRLDDGMEERPIPGTDLTISSPGTFCSAAGMAQVFYHDMRPDPLWDAYSSPECVAMSFTVHQCNIDSMEAAA